MDKNITWSGKPEKKPYMFDVDALFLINLGFFMLFLSICIFILAVVSLIGLFAICFVIALFGYALYAILTPLIRLLELRNISYTITNKKIDVRFGLIGIDSTQVYLDQISSVHVRVTFIDKLFKLNTGSVYITTLAGTTITLRNIRQPYKLSTLIKSKSFILGTDVKFPNKLRPEENPGYQTRKK